ncbi:hypothetical protein G7B40_039875 [Aetokthonos hydrillicola Thurmond2011]|uniref:Mobilization protein n=2 Tax=Aetokthonos TaxID=1550243 RepID=A0AAP5MCT5_9CYAN|nr:hypothetical protein [Aetokthonos hydrillicola Thurmond2011]
MAETYKQRRQRLDKIQKETKELQKEIKEIRRKEETRQFIILGRWVTKLLQRGFISQEFYQKDFGSFLTRNADRELFGFPPLPTAEIPNTQKKPAKQKKQQPLESTSALAIFADPPPSATTDKQQPSNNGVRKLPEYDDKNLQEAFDL